MARLRLAEWTLLLTRTIVTMLRYPKSRFLHMAVTKLFIKMDAKGFRVIWPTRGVAACGGVATTPLTVHIVTVFAIKLVE